MTRGELQREFIERIQQCIDRYQPILEEEFRVDLGNVAAKPLIVGEFINHCFAKGREQLRRETQAKHGREPTSLRWAWYRLEELVTWPLGYLLIYLRFWFPEFIMKSFSNPPAVIVSFLGWSKNDFRKPTVCLDQWTVHELAHNVWCCLAEDEFEDHDRRWRIWNEGFAHYVADVTMRHHYPSDVEVNID
jgi:hypothetical protein